MNFLPKNVFNGVNSDGSTFTMREWDFRTLANIQGIAFFITLLLICLACPIVSPILLIVCLSQQDNRIVANNILGILFSIYFLIDCGHNWLSVRALNVFFEIDTIKFILALNIATLVAHFVLLFIGIYKNNNKVVITVIVVIVLFMGFIVGVRMAPSIGKPSFDARIHREALDAERLRLYNEN